VRLSRPLADHLLTPENAAFLSIDYQPSQLAAVLSMDPTCLLKNSVSTLRTIRPSESRSCHSTVNVAFARGDTARTAGLLAGGQAADRNTNHRLGGPSNSSRPSTLAVAASSSSPARWDRNLQGPSPRSTRARRVRGYPFVDAIAASSPEPTAPALTA